MNGALELIPVGIVRSSVMIEADMPLQGVRGEIEIFPAYWDALNAVENNSHLILLCWMHHGSRDLLLARARKVSEDLPEKGVFALRSPSRPNPVSVSVVRLVKKRDFGILEVDQLDLIDGTPVIDIKPYQPGWDAVFSAVNPDPSIKIRKMGPARYRETLIREAVNYHGKWCSGTALAVRIAEKATELVGGDLKRPEISIDPGTDPCLADGIIGITFARFGNGRLRMTRQISRESLLNRVIFFVPGKIHTFTIKPARLDPDEILEVNEKDLFSVESYEHRKTEKD